jgi:hypothetical protein
MRKYPEKPEELQEETERLHPEPWQLKLIKLNPSYVWWGNFEDYMSDKNTGWRSPAELKSWKEHWELDELNECVNFYFEIHRKNHECPHCEGSGLNPATKQLSDDWYDFAETGRRWDKKLTEVEVEALVRHRRITEVSGFNGYFADETGKWMVWKDNEKVECEAPQMPTPEAVNLWASGRGLGHDGINQWICVKARAQHLGVYGHCEHCIEGYIYDEDKAKVGLQLWMLHPRKGCSRGVYFEEILEEEVPAVLEWLKEAAKRNAERFSKL